MTETYRVVVVGLGGMGRHHAEAVVAADRCELVGGAEVDPGRAKAWQSRFDAPVFGDYESMMEDLEPDIAIVATQAPLHHPVTVAAARRKIHVLCEKPIALDLAQADDMVDSCDDFGVRLAVNHIKRGSAYNRHVQELVGSGEIGQLLHIRASEKGGRKVGNALMEMGTHLFDWICLFAGKLEWTHAHFVQFDGRQSTASDILHSREVNLRDRDAGLVLGERGFVSFRFDSGIHADAEFLSQSDADDRDYGLDLIGTKGRIALRGSVGTWMFIHEGEHQQPQEHWQPVTLDAEDLDEQGGQRDSASKQLLIQKNLLEDLVAAIEAGRDPISSGRDGRASLEMIHSAWESQRQGGRIYAHLTPRTRPLERWLTAENLPMRQAPPPLVDQEPDLAAAFTTRA